MIKSYHIPNLLKTLHGYLEGNYLRYPPEINNINHGGDYGRNRVYNIKTRWNLPGVEDAGPTLHDKDVRDNVQLDANALSIYLENMVNQQPMFERITEEHMHIILTKFLEEYGKDGFNAILKELGDSLEIHHDEVKVHTLTSPYVGKSRKNYIPGWNREPHHTFKYWEECGAVYGTHHFIEESLSEGKNLAPIRTQWKKEPTFIDRLSNINIKGPRSFYDSTEYSCCLSNYVSVTSDGEVSIENEEMYLENNGDKRELHIHMGEFHLLPDTPVNIYRCNIAWDLLYIKDDNKYMAGEEGTTAIMDGVTRASVFGDTVSEARGAISSPRITPDQSHFLSYYIGLCKLPAGSTRPKEMREGDLSMRHPDYIEAGAQIRWKSMKDRCTTWVRVYDGTDVADIIDIKNYNPDHYIINTKVVIDIPKCKQYFKTLTSGVGKDTKFKIAMYPVSYNVLGYKTVTDIIYPKLNNFLDDFDELVFNTPVNYLTRGSFHFTLEMYEDNGEKHIFSDSSLYSFVVHNETSKINKDTPPGKWMYKDITTNEWTEIPHERDLTFNRVHDRSTGVNHEDYQQIKYIPSDDIMGYVAGSMNLAIRINVYDSTIQ